MRHSGPGQVHFKHHTKLTCYEFKYEKSYMWHDMYENPFTKVLGLVGCQVTSKFLFIGPSESNWKDYMHVKCDQRSRLQSESSNNQYILYGAAKMHKNSIMGTRCVYNWTDVMVDMGLDNILDQSREPRHARIFNAWIKY